MLCLSSYTGFLRQGSRGFFVALLLLTLLGTILRTVKLGDYPGGFGQDEAVVLYDAWSLLTTGAEHHGDRWPINAREFGDYPSALPSYYMMPLVALFGPTAFVSRIFCALLNAAAVFFCGLLVRRLFRSNAAGVFAAALLAVSPWNLFFSRWSVSAGFCTFFQVFALWLLHRLLTGEGARGRSVWAAILVGFSLFLWTHEYLSQYFFAPFMIGMAMLLWCRGNWRRIFIAGGVYSLLMLAAIWIRVSNPAASGRMQCSSIFYTGHILELFWKNYCHYQSFSFLFKSPTMLALHQIPGVPHIQRFLLPFYLLGLGALTTAVFAPGWLLRHLGRPDSPSDVSGWRRSAIWMLAGFALAPLAGACFLQQFYTARLTHLLVQVLLITSVGCAVFWYWLRRLPLRAAGTIFIILLALYLGQQTFRTARGLIRNNVSFKRDLQQGVPEVMQYLAKQPNVHSAKFPRLLQGYIYHLLFTPVHPSQVNHAEVSPPEVTNQYAWRYSQVSRVGHYYFDQDLDRGEIAKTATLRHQVRDADRVWYDLYERNGDWFVLPHE
ncbi:MAG: hypothetical protein WCO42_07110 [bacterium]